MGFYAPAQIVRDARDHGVEVRPVCINASRWDCTLEPGNSRYLAVRLGLRQARGLANVHGAAIVVARGIATFGSVEEVWRRAGVPRVAIERLAEADAFHALGQDRRTGLWKVRGLGEAPLPLFAAADEREKAFSPEGLEPDVALAPMTDGRAVVEDYRSLQLSLRAHPLTFLRDELARAGIVRCADLLRIKDGRHVKVAGLILVRQKPGSAKGVLFITIEDETGVANGILWADRFEAQRRTVMTAHMVTMVGRVPRVAIERLAEADAFHALGQDRRQGLWKVRGLGEAPLPLFAAADEREEAFSPEGLESNVALAPMTDGREVVEDYRSLQLSLRAHPLTFLRDELARAGIVRCADLSRIKDGRHVKVAGLILVRQKPGSAKGVLFITIEDETGVANGILWADRFEAQRRTVMTAHMVTMVGRVQREGEVIHVIIDRLIDEAPLLRRIGGMAMPHKTGRGDGARHGGAPVRGDPGWRRRDSYWPPHADGMDPEAVVRVKSRDFH